MSEDKFWLFECLSNFVVYIGLALAYRILSNDEILFCSHNNDKKNFKHRYNEKLFSDSVRPKCGLFDILIHARVCRDILILKVMCCLSDSEISLKSIIDQ